MTTNVQPLSPHGDLKWWCPTCGDKQWSDWSTTPCDNCNEGPPENTDTL